MAETLPYDRIRLSFKDALNGRDWPYSRPYASHPSQLHFEMYRFESRSLMKNNFFELLMPVLFLILFQGVTLPDSACAQSPSKKITPQ